MYMSVLTQLYLQNCGKNQLHVSALNGWAVIRLKLGSQRKFIHYDVYYTSRTEGGGGMRSRFTIVLEAVVKTSFIVSSAVPSTYGTVASSGVAILVGSNSTDPVLSTPLPQLRNL
jgi:hypothetical protein